jgi:hypothetical protein
MRRQRGAARRAVEAQDFPHNGVQNRWRGLILISDGGASGGDGDLADHIGNVAGSVARRLIY